MSRFASAHLVPLQNLRLAASPRVQATTLNPTRRQSRLPHLTNTSLPPTLTCTTQTQTSSQTPHYRTRIAHASDPSRHRLPHNVNLPLLPRPPPHLHSPQTHLPPPAPQQHSNRPHRPHCPTRPAHRRTPYHHRARRCAAPAFQSQQHGQRRHAGRGVCGV